MIKLRYKFYIILFFIFIVISVSFAVIINLTANYSRGDLKNVYYNTLYDTARKNIILYTNSIYEMILFDEQEFIKYDKEKRKEFIGDFVNGIRDKNFNYEIYLQEAIVYDKNNISVQNIYSSKYDQQEEYKKYGKGEGTQKAFYPAYELLTKLEDYTSVFDKESFYLNEKNLQVERVFFCKYIPQSNLLITSCFYEQDLKAAAEDYAKSLEIENEDTVSFFLYVTVFIIIALFVVLCYIESLYYKSLEKNFLSEKLKINEKYNRLKEMSQIDALTKCYNRKYLNEKMVFAFKSFQAGHLVSSAILFDIDNFKKINDTYGHSAGDEVLKQVAETVRNCIRKDDVFARWGGEEFVIFFKFTNIRAALVIAEKIRAAVEALVVSVPGHDIKITVSLGVSCFKLVDSDLSECIERADDAMYESKKTGKNKVTLYSK